MTYFYGWISIFLYRKGDKSLTCMWYTLTWSVSDTLSAGVFQCESSLVV